MAEVSLEDPVNPCMLLMIIRQPKSHFFKMNIKSKPSIIYIKTSFERVFYTLGKNAISVLSSLKRPELRRRQINSCYFSARRPRTQS